MVPIMERHVKLVLCGGFQMDSMKLGGGREGGRGEGEGGRGQEKKDLS